MPFLLAPAPERNNEMRNYVVRISVDVYDVAALKRSAMARAKEEGLTAKDWRQTRGGIVDDLVMLLDPGLIPYSGTSIRESTAEEI